MQIKSPAHPIQSESIWSDYPKLPSPVHAIERIIVGKSRIIEEIC